MKKQLYCLFDKQTRTHMNPLVFVNHGDAIRWFTTVVNNADEKTNMIALYPHHYHLKFLGTLDDITGKFEGAPEDVIEGTSVKQDIAKFTVRELLDTLDKRYGFVENIELGGNGNAKRNEL